MPSPDRQIEAAQRKLAAARERAAVAAELREERQSIALGITRQRARDEAARVKKAAEQSLRQSAMAPRVVIEDGGLSIPIDLERQAAARGR